MWTAGEIRELLPDIVKGATGGATQADIFMHHYGVKEQGNVDPAQVWELEVFDERQNLSNHVTLILDYNTEANKSLCIDKLFWIIMIIRKFFSISLQNVCFPLL